MAFHFNGQRMVGRDGDTLASALLAAGVRLVGRSFKYHRPRGILTAGPEEPNALVELRTGARREPNSRATTIEIFEGLQAASQNCWPNVRFDLAAVNGLLSPLLVAGFYYKTFMWPGAFWERVYEPLIRRSAGLGRASEEADPDAYEKAHAFCDLLVIGAGPGGLAAALAAGRAGARVILCDEDFLLGGRLNAEASFEVDGLCAAAWAHRATAELEALPNVRVMRRTAVFGVYDGGVFGALERVADHLAAPAKVGVRQRYWKIVAKRSVLAAGAHERPIAFEGNDRPGVMLAASVRAYLARYGVLAGRQPVVFTGCDDGWRTAADLLSAGITPALVIDTRTTVPAHLRAPGVRQLLGGAVVETTGRPELTAIRVRRPDGKLETVACDLLAVSGGWNANLALTTHLGGRPRWDAEQLSFVPGLPPPGMAVVGAAAGAFTLDAALRDGFHAGVEAALGVGRSRSAGPPPTANHEACASGSTWRVPGARKAFVDFQNDVTVDDILLAEREGFRSVEHLKRYTTLGMGADQGKLSNVVGLAVMAELTGRGIPETGTTTFRPPYAPVAIGALAGRQRGREFRPERRTAGHDWAAARGATFVTAGLWLRPQWFARPGERDWLETVCREVTAVRTAVGVCDVSTLGKIQATGPDAGPFLDRVYANTLSTLPIGKARYGVMLREDGHVLDDGTVARFGSDRFLLSTTTANAAVVMQHLEYALQVTWPHFDVHLTSLTEQWAQFAIAGPNARRLLARLLGDAVDVSNAGLSFMGCREFDWRGQTARLFRISFSGELAYELAVPADVGESVLHAIFDVGEELGVTPYGAEALAVLRIEKGHVAGPELNGQTTAADLGLGGLMSKKKDFIGRTLAGRPALTDPDRPRLVGLRAVTSTARLRAGAHLVPKGVRPTTAADQGHITSVAYSPSLRRWIGLAFVRRGPERMGERLIAHDPLRSSNVEVELCSPVFLDPEGERLHA